MFFGDHLSHPFFLPRYAATVFIYDNHMEVGHDAAKLFCWVEEAEENDPGVIPEMVSTVCGDPTCPCCLQVCCDGEDCR